MIVRYGLVAALTAAAVATPAMAGPIVREAETRPGYASTQCVSPQRLRNTTSSPARATLTERYVGRCGGSPPTSWTQAHTIDMAGRDLHYLGCTSYHPAGAACVETRTWDGLTSALTPPAVGSAPPR